jgi:uncharacterized lipoprotein YddW (UPF0748 family)
MMKLIRRALALLVLAAPVNAIAQTTLPPPIPRELRGVWVTPLDAMTGPDWPSAPGLSPDQQRAEFRRLLDRARAIGLNAIVLHVRTAGDAMYPSQLVPWSSFLTGKQGVGPKPAYDPLAFAISEAHARGIQLHAWFNPFRAGVPDYKGKAAPNHVTRAHKTWIRKYGTQTWIDPGIPAARAQVLKEIMDVVDRYDVDAVHLDDYFYPYREQRTVTKRINGRRRRVREDIPFPDASTFKSFGKRFQDRADWRRANIDKFVEQLYREVKKRKPYVLVGISPFGIWRSGQPRGITGLDAYGEIYADARKWLMEGWVDYMAPQLYWPIYGEQQRFTNLDQWWRAQNPKGRAIWPGLFDAQVAVRREGWPVTEIAAQIERLRSARDMTDESNGHIHFRMGALLWNYNSIGENLRTTVYSEAALWPAMPWLGSSPPAAPRATNGAESIYVAPGDSIAPPTAPSPSTWRPATRSTWPGGCCRRSEPTAGGAPPSRTERSGASRSTRSETWGEGASRSPRSTGPARRAPRRSSI